MRLRVGHQHSQWWPILARFVFWGRRVISTINEPRGAFRVGQQHSQFWPILNRFVDCYSPFWGPKVISMVIEPQGAHMRRSSTLTVLANFGPFHGRFLTVLVSRSDFHD